jgi:hypothetical protein
MMDRANKYKSYAICIFIFTAFACQSQSFENFERELSWKKDWLSVFFLEYGKYQEETLPNCTDFARDISFDIERKTKGLFDIPFENAVFTVKKYIKANHVKFDSIVMVNVYGPMFETEYSFPPIQFYLFKNNLVQELYVYVDYNKKCLIRYPLKKVNQIEVFGRPSPGCGYGYVSYTKFDQKWTYYIQSIIINTNESN